MRIAPDQKHCRKAAAAAQPPNGVLRRPNAKIDALVIEVAFDGKSCMKRLCLRVTPTSAGFHKRT